MWCFFFLPYFSVKQYRLYFFGYTFPSRSLLVCKYIKLFFQHQIILIKRKLQDQRKITSMSGKQEEVKTKELLKIQFKESNSIPWGCAQELIFLQSSPGNARAQSGLGGTGKTQFSLSGIRLNIYHPTSVLGNSAKWSPQPTAREKGAGTSYFPHIMIGTSMVHEQRLAATSSFPCWKCQLTELLRNMEIILV